MIYFEKNEKINKNVKGKNNLNVGNENSYN